VKPLISPNIFRLYDIRGVVDRDLSEEAAYKIARALAAQAAQRGWNKVLKGYNG
jgi:phosphomannomutase/phosphoglucomutase